tara:strand:- start:40 stop:297 length:258 start_codon:yes stop_codon:yes gene_type:complete
MQKELEKIRTRFERQYFESCEKKNGELKNNYALWLERELVKKLIIPVVVKQSELLFCENVIHHNCKWFDEYNGCMGCLVKKHEAK